MSYNKNSTFKNLDAIDKNIVLLKQNEPGITIAEIAERLGKSRSTIDKRLVKPELKKILQSSGEDAYRILKKGQADAAKRLLDIGLKDKDTRVAVMAIKEIIKDVLAERKKIEDDNFNLAKYLGQDDVDELIEEEE